MSVPVKLHHSDAIESVIAHGDLSKLTVEQRNKYYSDVCRSLGQNPRTQPFAYINLNGKLTLYAKRDCADQLRKINGISIAIVSQEMADGLLTVHVRGSDASGRTDEDLGVVAFPENLKGEMRANAILKCVTKAKRRVTLSISGLGFLDETEVEDIPANDKQTVTSDAVDVSASAPISAEQLEIIQRLIIEVGADIPIFCQYFGLNIVADLQQKDFERAKTALEKKRQPKPSVEHDYHGGLQPPMIMSNAKVVK